MNYTKRYTSKKSSALNFLENVKSYQYVLILLIVVFLFFKNQIKSLFSSIDSTIGQIGNTLTELEVQSLNSRIRALIQGYTSASQEAEIVDLLIPLSLSDYNRLSNEFGEEWYSVLLGEFGLPYISSYLNLTEILALELSDSEKQRLRTSAAHLNIV